MQIDAAANRVHRIEIVMPARAGDTRDQHIQRLRIGARQIAKNCCGAA